MNSREKHIPDFRTPSAARMYDYLLGGKDNFPADREMADRVLAVYPEARTLAMANRRFLTRAVWYLAEHGIKQYVDLGCGMPTSPMVHEIARNVRPDAKVVYVDNDPVVATHFRAACDSGNGLAFIECDIRAAQDLLNDAQLGQSINFSAPVAFLCVAALHFVPDEDHPKRIVAALRWRMAPGSYLVISHALTDDTSKGMLSVISDVGKQTNAQQPIPRTVKEISEFFTGLDLVDPGLVDMSRWRPDQPGRTTGIRFLAGVGRKSRDLRGIQQPDQGTTMEDSYPQGKDLDSLRKLSDPDFMTQWAALRTRLFLVPKDNPEYQNMQRRYAVLAAEYTRRVKGTRPEKSTGGTP